MAITLAGIDPTIEACPMQDAIRAAIAATWVWRLAGRSRGLGGSALTPEQQTYCGKAVVEPLAWCLVWLMVEELGVGQFTIRGAKRAASPPVTHSRGGS